jgi:hypothetical protein
MFHYNPQNLFVKYTTWFCSVAMLTGHGQQMYRLQTLATTTTAHGDVAAASCARVASLV